MESLRIFHFALPHSLLSKNLSNQVIKQNHPPEVIRADFYCVSGIL